MAKVRYKGRIALLAVAILAVFTGIGIRLTQLHLHPAEWIFQPIREGRLLEQKLVGNRGRIVDRNGEILAMDLSAYHVVIDPVDIIRNGHPGAVRDCLIEALHLQPDELERFNRALADADQRYVRVRKYVPGYQLKQFERRAYGVNYSPEAAGGGATNIFLRGLVLEETPVRNYPKGALMAHVVGFANHEGVGSAGIEMQFDDYLRGGEGIRVSKKDGRRREIYITRTVDIEPEDGADVMLTLDQHLQYVTEQTIEEMCRESHARAAWAIVMQVRTGEVLAMASYPTYDLNRFGKAPEEWRRNRAISYNYEPGSTMKAAVIASALDQGIVKETDLIDCENGYWVYGGKSLKDSHAEGILSVADVIKVSSNIGAAKIALMMGDQLLYDSLKKFHFGDRLQIGIPGEEAGIFYSPAHWSKISATRIGMGHEIAATALQVLSMMNTIANNGVQMRPMLVKRITAPDGTVLKTFEPEQMGRPISPPTSRRMRELLARVTEEGGTGTKASVEGYRVAGKTGTAQKIRPAAEGGGYYEKNFVVSFAGFLPVERPEISIIVVADDPGSYTESGRKVQYYGGTVCGPAFKRIAEQTVRYLRVSSGGDKIYVARPEL